MNIVRTSIIPILFYWKMTIKNKHIKTLNGFFFKLFKFKLALLNSVWMEWKLRNTRIRSVMVKFGFSSNVTNIPTSLSVSMYVCVWVFERITAGYVRAK